jgi:hypothetical protein
MVDMRADGEMIYSLPCGSKLTGFLVSPSADQLRVAAVVRRNSYFCAGLPVVGSISAKKLGIAANAKWGQFEAKHFRRSVVLRPSSEMRVRVSRGAASLTVNADQGCAKEVGMIFRPEDDGIVTLTAAELESKKCSIAAKSLTITGLDSASVSRFELSDSSRKEVNELSLLSLRPIEHDGIRKNGESGVSVDFVRSCNESPVGVASLVNQRGQTELAMLVARYPNLLCATASERETYSTSLLRYSTKLQAAVKLPKNATGFDFELVGPKSFDAETRPTGATFAVDGSCGKNVAVVYSSDKQQNGLVAILRVLTKDRGCRFEAARKIENISQPEFSAAALKGKILPMRLIHSTAL